MLVIARGGSGSVLGQRVVLVESPSNSSASAVVRTVADMVVSGSPSVGMITCSRRVGSEWLELGGGFVEV